MSLEKELGEEKGYLKDVFLPAAGMGTLLAAGSYLAPQIADYLTNADIQVKMCQEAGIFISSVAAINTLLIASGPYISRNLKRFIFNNFDISARVLR